MTVAAAEAGRRGHHSDPEVIFPARSQRWRRNTGFSSFSTSLSLVPPVRDVSDIVFRRWVAVRAVPAARGSSRASNALSVTGLASPAAKAGTKAAMSSTRLPIRGLITPDNLDVVLPVVVRLLPATILLSKPRRPLKEVYVGVEGDASPGTGDPMRKDGRGRGRRQGGDGAESEAITGGTKSRSPYEETECLGMVFQCLVEACTECLEAGTW